MSLGYAVARTRASLMPLPPRIRERGPLLEPERLGACSGCHTRALAHFGGVIAEEGTQRAAEHLAPLGEPAADEGEELGFRRHRDEWRLATAEPHQDRLDVRLGNEHRGRDGPEERGLGVVRDLHRHRAVVAPTRRRSEALAHLTLHHHHDAGDGRRLFEQPDHHRDRDVVGKVGDARPVRAVGEKLGQVDRGSVADAHVDRIGVRTDRGVEHGLQHPCE